MAGERELPGVGLFAFWTLGSNGYKDQLDENFRKLSALVMPYVLSSVPTVPGSPSDGDIYRLTSAPNLNSIAVRDAGSWVYLVPEQGWQVYDRGAGGQIRFNGSSWVALSDAPVEQTYDIRSAFGDTPEANALIDRIPIVRNITIPANMAGSVGFVTSNPTSTFTISIKDDGTDIGYVSVSTSGVVTFSTVSGTSKSIVSGSLLSFVSQATVDATIEGLTVTILGTLS